MKNVEIQEFFNTLKTITVDENGEYQIDNYNRFKYAVIRNIKKLEPIIEGFKDVVKIPDNYEQYIRELQTAQQSGDQNNINETLEKWKDTIKEVHEYNLKHSEFMQDEFTESIKFVDVKLEDIPGKIPTKFYYFIDPMIKDED